MMLHKLRLAFGLSGILFLYSFICPVEAVPGGFPAVDVVVVAAGICLLKEHTVIINNINSSFIKIYI